MDYLASPEAMELPDQIEEVNAKQLDTLVQEKMFVAVLFCKLYFLSLLKTKSIVRYSTRYVYYCEKLKKIDTRDQSKDNIFF